MQRRRFLTALALPPAALLLAGCGTLGGPQVITLGEAELSNLVNRAFPQTRRLLELLDVELSAPQLRLLPDSNRLAVVLSLTTRERLLGNAGRGQLQFNSALRYEPQDASLRLSQVRVQQIGFERLPAGLALPDAAPARPTTQPALPAGSQQLSQTLAQALAERVLEDLVLYRLSAERQARLRQLGLQPGAVTVTARGVEVTLARLGS